MRARIPLTALLAGLLLSVPAAAQAAAGWLPDRFADTGETNQTITGDADPVFDKDGTMVVITERYNSGQAQYLTNAYVKPPGGDFTRQQLSDQSDILPDVARDPRGGVAVAWLSGDSIMVVRRPPGGTFGPPETIPTGLTKIFNLQMEIGPDGRETFAFVQSYTKGANTGHNRLRVVSRSGPGAPLGVNKVVSPNTGDSSDGRVGHFELAIGTSGAAVLAFEYQQTYPASFNAALEIVRRGAADADFGGLQTVAPYTNDVSSADVALDASGRATVVFCQVSGGLRRAWVANAPADAGNFDLPVVLSPEVTNPNTNYSRIALAPDGSAVVGFGGGGGTASKWITRRGPGQPAFDSPTRVNQADQNVEPPEVAIGADDVAYAIVRSGANVFASDLDVYRSAAAGAPFVGERVAKAAAAGDAFEYGIGSQGAGNAVALYKGKVGTDTQRTLIAVPYDSAPPTVTLTAPTPLVLGVPGDFLAKPLDYWGPVTTAIAYDDGATGASHAFSTLGLHTATATATDAAGLTATATASTTVVKAPPGAGGASGGDSATPGSKKDRLAPRLSLGLKRGQHVLSGLKLTLRADEAATAKLSLKVAVRCGGVKKAKTLSLASATVKLSAGATRTVTLKASKRGKGRLRAAQTCGAPKSTATLKVSIADVAGNVAKLTKSVSVR